MTAADDQPFELLPVRGGGFNLEEACRYFDCMLYDAFYRCTLQRVKAGPLTPTLGDGQLLGEVVAP